AIQRWSSYIAVLADFYGLDPDFIAAVVKEESNGDPLVVSRVGAVGLMGVMPAGPGLEWRPPAKDLENASTNLRWGVAILSEIVRQSGGDLYAALAAYSGGWSQVERGVPRDYAARVLDNYGRAVAQRSGISPDIASQWTLAVEIRQGDVPNESLLVLGDQPVSGLLTYGEHVVYNYIDQSGQAYFVKGYAVPVALVMPVGDNSTAVTDADSLEVQLQARLDQTKIKISESNPRIIEACLPSLSRLRGHASTRWFAPSYCPSWHR
ncbi:MAG: transglycosylase SLT domain-containing protein, partial [Anaerolineae bacterium]